jgi:hypothetical protein
VEYSQYSTLVKKLRNYEILLKQIYLDDLQKRLAEDCLMKQSKLAFGYVIVIVIAMHSL